MDIYISVLFPTWADLGFVSMFSKTPPLIDLQDFASLLAVHRLVLHRREEQVLAVKRIPVSTTQPNTPWMPIVQRRVLRQTVLVAQAAKKGRLGQMMRSNSSMNLGTSMNASSFILSQSSLAAGQQQQHSESSLRERTNSLHSNYMSSAAGAGVGGDNSNNQLSRLQRSASVHSTGNVSSNSQQQHENKKPNPNKSGTTPLRRVVLGFIGLKPPRSTTVEPSTGSRFIHCFADVGRRFLSKRGTSLPRDRSIFLTAKGRGPA